MQDITGAVVETNPARFRVCTPIDDERLHVTLDEDLDIVGVKHEQDDG